MSADLIISYDGTVNDNDALELGKLLAAGGVSMALAYVRHSREFDPDREALAQHDAERRLARGAAEFGDESVPQHVVISASTGQGLAKLAESEEASVIVFGSDYRTPPGHAEPGQTAQTLLDGGAFAIAVAAAGLRSNGAAGIGAIKVPAAGPYNDNARATAKALAAKLGATITESATDPVDLIVVGSQPNAPEGHIVLGGDVRSELARARSSVLVLPQGKTVFA